MAAAMLFAAASMAVAQDTNPAAPAPESKMSTPNGYTAHHSVDMGGRMTNIVGSGAMYNTLVNLQDGPRVLGETFDMHALPTNKKALVDNLTAFGSGFGGDPNIMAKLDANKSKYWEFSGLFRRDRLYSDYDLLANPNIPPGMSIPIGPANAPVGQQPWPLVLRSPVMFNTVRRMTDTYVTLMPLSNLTYRFGYSHYTMEGPTLSPSYTLFGMKYNALLQEWQRNGTDDYMAGIDWKPSTATKVSLDFEGNRYRFDSHFQLDPNGFYVQEADGTKAYLGNYTSFTPYGIAACNTNSMGSDYTSSTVYTILHPANASGGLPIINPACAVVTSYNRYAPARTWLPTETLRFQTTALKNITMNGEAGYTLGTMNMPNYYEGSQGLNGAIRSGISTGGYARAHRHSFYSNYAIAWKVAPTVTLTDQVNYSTVAQPGYSIIPAPATLSTPTTAGNQTINYSGPLTPGTGSLPHGVNGTLTNDYYGQEYIINTAMVAWDATSNSVFTLAYRFSNRNIGQGVPHSGPIPPVASDPVAGTIAITENAGVFTAALHPAKDWDLNGSAEVGYADNAFTAVGQRQFQIYRVHTIYRPKTWTTITGSFSDRERHNNTNNNQDAVAAGDVNYNGPIDHVDHNRIGSVAMVMAPSEHYSFNFNYSYSDVYAATNICYANGAAAGIPGAAQVTAAGTPNLCQGNATWFARDLMHAPTQVGSAGLTYNPVDKVQTGFGYLISSVNGSRFFNDARDVNGSMVSTWQTPYVNLAYAMHPWIVWKAEYNFYGYGEGGPSGAPLCSVATSPTAVITPCASSPFPTGLTLGPAGATLPRNFHANNVTLSFHFEF